MGVVPAHIIAALLADGLLVAGFLSLPAQSNPVVTRSSGEATGAAAGVPRAPDGAAPGSGNAGLGSAPSRRLLWSQ